MWSCVRETNIEEMEKGGYHSASSNPSDFTYRKSKSEETKQNKKRKALGGGHDPKEPTDPIPSAKHG